MNEWIGLHYIQLVLSFVLFIDVFRGGVSGFETPRIESVGIIKSWRFVNIKINGKPRSLVIVVLNLLVLLFLFFFLIVYSCSSDMMVILLVLQQLGIRNKGLGAGISGSANSRTNWGQEPCVTSSTYHLTIGGFYAWLTRHTGDQSTEAHDQLTDWPGLMQQTKEVKFNLLAANTHAHTHTHTQNTDPGRSHSTCALKIRTIYSWSGLLVPDSLLQQIRPFERMACDDRENGFDSLRGLLYMYNNYMDLEQVLLLLVQRHQ